MVLAEWAGACGFRLHAISLHFYQTGPCVLLAFGFRSVGVRATPFPPMPAAVFLWPCMCVSAESLEMSEHTSLHGCDRHNKKVPSFLAGDIVCLRPMSTCKGTFFFASGEECGQARASPQQQVGRDHGGRLSIKAAPCDLERVFCPRDRQPKEAAWRCDRAAL